MKRRKSERKGGGEIKEKSGRLPYFYELIKLDTQEIAWFGEVRAERRQLCTNCTLYHVTNTSAVYIITTLPNEVADCSIDTPVQLRARNNEALGCYGNRWLPFRVKES